MVQGRFKAVSTRLLQRIGLSAAALLLGPLATPAVAREVIIGWPATITMNLAPIAAGIELGLFQKEGLSIRVVELKGTSMVLPQVVSKGVDFGFVGAEPLAVLKQPGRSPMPVKYFYNATPFYNWEIIVPEAGPVHKIEDLKGKKVGVQVLTNTHMPITRVLLKNHGLVEGRDYSFQTIGYSGQALYSLMRGDADAYYIGWNEIANYQAMGAKLRILPMDREIKTLFGNGYVAAEDRFKSDPQTMVGFGRAMAQATLACLGALEWCVKATWKVYPQVKLKDGTEAEIMAKSVPVVQTILKTMLPQGLNDHPRYGAFSEESWSNLLRFLHEGGELQSRDIPTSTLYSNELVDQINVFDRKALMQTISNLK